MWPLMSLLEVSTSPAWTLSSTSPSPSPLRTMCTGSSSIFAVLYFIVGRISSYFYIYVLRIGRTGRAGKNGTAHTFFHVKDIYI